MIQTIEDGETTFTTIESGGGSTAHLNMVPDGNFVVDAVGDITLDAAGGDVTILQADVTIPVDKKVIFGNTGEYIVGDNTDLDIVSSGRLTNTAVGAYKVDSGASIILDSATGAFQMKGAGTTSEFSVANSAYAGMIIGYVVEGINQTPATYTLSVSNSLVASGTHHVSFIAPPSGVVEIEVQINYDAGTLAQTLKLGLSDHTSLLSNSLPSYLVHQVYESGRGINDMNVINKWVVTGLTAGDTYKWYLTAYVNSTSGTPKLQWGGDSVSENPLFIMKATALPTAITDFAIYG